jgi:4'-phosphopantetheinyl transferase
LLENYTGIKAEKINFLFNKYNKPFLNDHVIEFNLSHSKDFVLIGFTKNHALGVDVEYINPTIDFFDLAPRVFTKNEQKQLGSISLNMQRFAFYQGWTCKEAFIKAKGKGLAFPLLEFEVSLMPGKIKLINTFYEPKDKNSWTLNQILPGPNYIGSFAVKSPTSSYKYFSWN